MVCPPGYYEHLPLKTCLSCAINCVSMAISNQLSSNNQTLEFTFTFSHDIDFASWNYADFLSGFTCTNSSINTLTDFNIVQTIISPTQFKLSLTPIPTKYLVNESFCAVVAPQATNPYQQSLALKKFDSSIYSMSSCVIWSTPQTYLSITNFIDPVYRYLEFTFTFTS